MVTREREGEKRERKREENRREREQDSVREREGEGEGARERYTHTLSHTHGVGGTVEWQRRVGSLVFADLFPLMSPKMSGVCAETYLTLLKVWYLYASMAKLYREMMKPPKCGGVTTPFI